MARQVPSGTPSPLNTGYVRPVDSRRVWRWSAGVAGVLIVLLVGLYFSQEFAPRAVPLSPGRVAGVHAAIDFSCAQCHTTGHAVADVRCERCHDPAGAERMTNAAHVLLGSGDARKAAQAPTVPCVTCHTDHRGRQASLHAVDDRECASCHTFSSFARHPEFAVVRAGATTGLGMRFPHDVHLADVNRATGADCAACHRPTVDQRGFAPIAFDDHCASCHTNNGKVKGESESIEPQYLTSIDKVTDPGAAVAGGRLTFATAGRGRKQLSGMSHRDPYCVYVAMRLRRTIDPDAVAADRGALAAQVSWLQQARTALPLGSMSAADLAPYRTALGEDVARISAQLAAAPAPGDDRAALDQMTVAVQTLARQLGPLDATVASEASNLAGPAVPGAVDPPRTDDNASALFDRRRAELARLLVAVGNRGDDRVKGRAAALKARLDALKYSASSDRADLDSLQSGLLDLDDALKTVGMAPDEGAQFEAAQIDVLRRFALEQVGRGLSPDDFETRRLELLSLLDEVEKRGDPVVRLRLADLRRRIAAVRPGASGDAELRTTLRLKRRLLDRLDIEQELDRLGERVGPLTVTASQDAASIDESLRVLRMRLADLDKGPRVNVADTPGEREAAGNALSSLMVPCTKCHDLVGSRLSTVRIAQPVMTRSVFNHAPHITQATCDVCHASVRTSKLSSDINSPGVQVCQRCHSSRGASSECETCHVYHPRSLSAFVRTP